MERMDLHVLVLRPSQAHYVKPILMNVDLVLVKMEHNVTMEWEVSNVLALLDLAEHYVKPI
jgi:hypothetical protein